MLTIKPWVMVVFILGSQSAHAEITTKWNVFGSLGGMNLHDKYKDDLDGDGIDEDFSVNEVFALRRLSKLGLQTSLRLNDKTSFTLQGVVAGNHIKRDKYEPTLEWAYLSYDLKPDMRLRIGRMRRPMFEYSDYINLSFGYAWPEPPRYSYNILRAIISTVDAVNLYYQGSYKNWGFSSETYFNQHSSGEDYIYAETATYSTKKNIGTILTAELDAFAFRIGLHQTQISYELPTVKAITDGLLLLGYPDFAKSLESNNKIGRFASLGVSYTKDNWKVFGELINYYALDALVGGTFSWYASVQRSFGNLTLNYTYNYFNAFPGSTDYTAPIRNEITQIDNDGGLASQVVSTQLALIADGLDEFTDNYTQHIIDHSISARYDVNANFALKLSYDYSMDTERTFDSKVIFLSLDFIY